MARPSKLTQQLYEERFIAMSNRIASLESLGAAWRSEAEKYKRELAIREFKKTPDFTPLINDLEELLTRIRAMEDAYGSTF